MSLSCLGCNLKYIFMAVLSVSFTTLMFLTFKGVMLRSTVVPIRRNTVAILNRTNPSKTGWREHIFDMRGNDVMVFLHIQKTGGTIFGNHLIKDLDIERPCACTKESRRLPKKGWSRVCHCFRPGSTRIWLFSRFHLGWPCGLHADWTEHKECVPKYMNKREGRNKLRKFIYITILREPVSRFVSEFYFVLRKGDMWRSATLRCNGRSPTKEELPLCFERENLSDITFEEFIGCPWNLAFNRQTRMLADLRRVNCYNTTGISTEKRGKVMLESAMRNLREMAFFGLTEYQEESQYLFEKTFGLKFQDPFTQFNLSETTAGTKTPKFNSSMLSQIKALNSLDLKLYEFARDLFFKRSKRFRKTDRISMKKRSSSIKDVGQDY